MKAMGLSRCQRQLLEELGDAYCTNRIDGASCIYRDYGHHDVEICGGRTIRAPYDSFLPCLQTSILCLYSTPAWWFTQFLGWSRLIDVLQLVLIYFSMMCILIMDSATGAGHLNGSDQIMLTVSMFVALALVSISFIKRLLAEVK